MGPEHAASCGWPGLLSSGTYLLSTVSKVNLHKHRWFLWREIRDSWMTGVAEPGECSFLEGAWARVPQCSGLGIRHPRSPFLAVRGGICWQWGWRGLQGSPGRGWGGLASPTPSGTSYWGP